MGAKKKELKKNKPIVVAVSGGFDPVHVGHVRMFNAAKRLGDKLIVILNNDNWLRKKKGYVFMAQKERKEIIQAFGAVDKVIFTRHPKDPKDMSVSRELRIIRPDIFANGGDRRKGNLVIAELDVCRQIGCRVALGVGGGKVQSSSWLIHGYASHSFCPCGSKRRWKKCHGA